MSRANISILSITLIRCTIDHNVMRIKQDIGSLIQEHTYGYTLLIVLCIPLGWQNPYLYIKTDLDFHSKNLRDRFLQTSEFLSNVCKLRQVVLSKSILFCPLSSISSALEPLSTYFKCTSGLNVPLKVQLNEAYQMICVRIFHLLRNRNFKGFLTASQATASGLRNSFSQQQSSSKILENLLDF